MVNQICRMEPAPCISASLTVDLAFTSTQSALPPERSALDARLETASAQSSCVGRRLAWGHSLARAQVQEIYRCLQWCPYSCVCDRTLPRWSSTVSFSATG